MKRIKTNFIVLLIYEIDISKFIYYSIYYIMTIF